MALTSFQRDVCRLIAALRVRRGESYVAGGVALNEALGAARVSRDIDLFHDSVAAVERSFDEDRALLTANGCALAIQRRHDGFIEALVSRGTDRVLLQWTADSAYRFFPLVEHPDFGLALHPFDLATNKVLALVGRVEARDWVDVIGCHEKIQPLGYLAWAACGKDPGFSPSSILEHAARSSRYSAEEIQALEFEGPAPDAADLSRRWHAMLSQAREVVGHLPAVAAGRCVLDSRDALFRGGPAELKAALATGSLRFHEGRLRGSLPRVRGE